jgi:hypothetical protein
VEPSAILEALLEVAREAGLEVRAVERGEPDLPQPGSGVVKLKGRVFVMLSSVDPVAIQLEVLAAALREHAAGAIADRHLPPALRALLEPE